MNDFKKRMLVAAIIAGLAVIGSLMNSQQSTIRAAGSAFSQSDRDPRTYEFTYSIIGSGADGRALLPLIEATVLPTVQRAGARPYAVWTTVDRPGDTPFAGLAANQVILMVAWPENAARAIPPLEVAIRGLTGVTSVSSRVFLPVYLVDGLNVPTTTGFYVHREEHYGRDNVDEAVRLSREAWRTWEPFWKVKVIGLFRESPDPSGFVNLNRIVWYPSYKVWLDTRRASEEPQSEHLFDARNKLKIGGQGVAIATNRFVP
jgi:hypothetical protein